MDHLVFDLGYILMLERKPAVHSSPAKLRVCRIIFSYPTDLHTGAGLPAYYLSDLMPFETLHITRRMRGNPRPIGSHVRLHLVGCPNPQLSGPMKPWVRLGRSIAKLMGLLLFALRAAPRLLLFRPHVVHIHTYLPIFLGPVGRAIGAKVVITLHGTDFIAIQKSRLLRAFYRWGVDEIWYVSEAMHAQLAHMFPGKPLRYTPSGVDQEIFRRAASVRKNQIVTVGRLAWQKGYPILLEAFREVHARFPSYSLLIIGEGPDRPKLETQIRELGLEEHVSLLGNCSQPEIAGTLSECRLFVLASVTEGFPKVLLEALSCGLPLVVTDVGSCGTLVRRHRVGKVVPPGDPAALAEGIIAMLSSRESIQEYGEVAEQVAGQYTWNAVARLVEQTYAEVALAS